METSPRARLLSDLLQEAGARALPVCGTMRPLHLKADDSPVTAADLVAEAVLLAGLRAGFPGDLLHSEEAGGGRSDDPAVGWWVIDPIDGTSAFTEGLAHWGPTVARFQGGRLDCGAIWLPRLSEFYYVGRGDPGAASGGLTALLNGQPLPPLSTRPVPSVIYLPSRFHRYGMLDSRCKARCLGGTAAHLAGVARGGSAATIVAPGWSLWDVAAGLGLLEAVGGLALRFDGAPLDPIRDEGVGFLAGFPEFVTMLLREGRLGFRSG